MRAYFKLLALISLDAFKKWKGMKLPMAEVHEL